MIPIPLEITDLIIKYTRTEGSSIKATKRELASCSLVCRSWRPFAQTRLFEIVWLNVNALSVDDFLAFLLSSPHLAASIRILCFCWRTHRWHGILEDDADVEEKSEDDSDADDKPEYCPLSPVLLMEVAAILSPMAVVRLEKIALLGWPSDTPLPKAPVRLHGLELESVVHKPEPFSVRSRTMAFDVSSFFELDTILFSKGRMAEPIHSAVPSDVLVLPAPGTRPVAHTVRIDGTDCFAALNLQCGGFDPQRLETLHFALEDFASLRFARSLLRGYENSIRNVEVEVSVNPVTTNHEQPEVASFWEIFDLTSCTRLESLYFFWNYIDFIPHQEQVLDICDAFSTLVASTPQTLNRLKFILPYNDGAQNLVNFASLLRSLAPRIEQAVQRLRGLRTIILRVQGLFSPEERTGLMGTARSTLPTRLLDSGVLQIDIRINPYRYTVG